MRLPQLSVRDLFWPFRVGLGLVCAVFIAGAIAILVTPPRFLVARFLNDVRAERFDDAYQQTSSAYQSYISRQAFPSYWGARPPLAEDAKSFGRGTIRRGTDCLDRPRLTLEVRHRDQLSRLVFVWENGWWKFDHESTP